MESGRADGRRFAAKLRRLRDLNGKMTQEELHYAPGVPAGPSSELQAGEEPGQGRCCGETRQGAACQFRGLLRRGAGQQEVLDEAAQVRLAAQLIFQLADAYCLEQIIDSDAVGITSSSGYMEYALAE